MDNFTFLNYKHAASGMYITSISTKKTKKNVLIYIFAGRKHTISEELMASLDGERKEGEWRGVE